MNSWETDPGTSKQVPPRTPAVAYYRHSAQDRQEISIAIQRDQFREWAEKNGVEFIKEFTDNGMCCLNAEERPAFNDMMDNWVKTRNDFQYILCFDISRWGRFQEIDYSAMYCAECKKHGKTVIFTSIGKPMEDDPGSVYRQSRHHLEARRNKGLSDNV